MAKEIKFNIKLLIDGKEQLVTASTSAKELRDNLDAAKSSAAKFREKMITVNQTVVALQNASSAINGLRDTMAGLTASYNAVQQANTQLTTVMRQRMDATEEDIKKVNEVIGVQSKLGVIGGTIQKTGAQQIATFLKEKGTLELLIPSMNDLLAQQKGLNATQEDARSVANLMGKAMTGQTSALRRVGITFSEAQENIMKYGTEQQRAAMLAQIITDNVGHMNAQLGKTDAGQLKQAEMQFAAIKVQIGELVSKWLPKITFAAQALTIVNSMISLGNSIKGATMVIANFGITTKAVNAVCIGFRASVVGLTAVTRVMQAAFTGATIGATTLKVAIKSLLISTGVGVAVWALTEAISYLATSSDKAAGSTKQLTAEEEAAQAARQQEAQQRAEISAAIDINIAKLKAFKGSKEEEKKLVGEMNNTYGDAMGYYSTVAQWYTALVGNSKAYCNQMINEIRIRDLANKAADLQQKRHDFTHDDNGKTRRFSKKRKTRQVAIGQVDAGDGKIIPQYADVEVKGSSDYEKANAKVTDLYRKEQVVRKQMESLVRENTKITYKQYDGYSKTAPTTPTKTTPTKTTTPKTTDKKDEPKTHVEELQAQLAAAQKEMGNAMTVDARVKADAKVADIQRQIDEATKGKVSIGAETEPTYIVQGSDADKRQSRTNAQHSIDRIRQDFEIGLIGKEDAERQIADINKQLEKLGVKPIEVHFKTYIEELQEQLHDAQQEFEEATTIDARVKADAKIDDIQRQIDEATKGKVSIKAETEPAYIVQGSAADKRQSHSNAQNKASRIQTDYEIGIIGKDEALKEIEEINRQLAEIGLKPIKIELDSKGFDKVFGDIKSGWGSIQGVGNGIQGISDALEGNGDAWQQVTGLINGFISIAEGIQGIVELFGMLTAATSAHAAASTTDAAATAGEAAAATANTAAKSGEAVANATASGAKMPFPLNLVAIAAGVAAVIAALAAVSGFATGGVIGGTSTSGDKKFARVNSGEMILNKFQQARLFGMIDGKFQPPTFTERRLQPVTMQNITNDIEPTATEVNINMNANARKILDMITDVKRVAKKSGKNYNV
jgi:hypothetical protein|nr:MAG TPA: Putative tail length tape measure protein [Caudoviricetes sp.]